MEVGYDYLLIRSRWPRRFMYYTAVFLLVIGVVAVGASAGYFAYAQRARADLDRLNYTSTVPTASDQPGGELSKVDAPSAELSSPQSELTPAHVSTVLLEAVEPIPTQTAASAELWSSHPENLMLQIPASAIASQALYPGQVLSAHYWSSSMSYEPAFYIQASLIKGFKPIDPWSVSLPGTLSAPTRIIIPAIQVDSKVESIKILDLGDSRAYDMPKWVVGHIPETANPGEKGSSWFFGHLESSVSDGGAVFYNLRKVPELLRNGQEVYAILESGKASYLYRLISSKVVHQDKMQLYDTGDATIHLVTCVPRLVYDHRLIVTGELVGVGQ